MGEGKDEHGGLIHNNSNYLPKSVPNDKGKYDIILKDGIHVRAYMCSNCNFLVLIKEPY